MGNWRDIVSSIIFYAGVAGGCALLVHYGSSYGWHKVDEQFRDMEPRLSRGHYVWIDRRARRPEGFAIGDVVMYKRPVWKRAKYHYEFARVIAKPGDVVEMKNYRLYRAERRDDGKLGPKDKVTERYIQASQRPKEFSSFVVPRNCLFVMYDDRRRRPPLRNLIVPTRCIFGRVLH